MPLPTRDHTADRVMQLRSDTRATRGVLNQLAADHGAQATGLGDDVRNQQDLDFAQHYGFVSRPAADTELVIVPGDPIDASVAEVCDIPSGDLASIGTGETAIYDSSGNFVYLRGTNGAWMKTLAGPITIEAKVKPVTIKVSGNPTLGVARYHDTVTAGATMTGWINYVNASLTTLGIPPPPGWPADFGQISGCSSDVVVS